MTPCELESLRKSYGWNLNGHVKHERELKGAHGAGSVEVLSLMLFRPWANQDANKIFQALKNSEWDCRRRGTRRSSSSSSDTSTLFSTIHH